MASSKELTALEKVYVQHEGRIFVDHFRFLTSKCFVFCFVFFNSEDFRYNMKKNRIHLSIKNLNCSCLTAREK